jgi:hypothetical protein
MSAGSKSLGEATNGRKQLDDFDDNDEVAYVFTEHSGREKTHQDITIRTYGEVKVTRREVREMFIQFLQNSPELQALPRREQILQYNLERREVKKPKVEADILLDLHVPLGDAKA